MNKKKVIISGLGALGLTYANKLKDICELKILADLERIERYKKNPPVFNNRELLLDYIEPSDNFNADLIIISTKSNGLSSVIENIKNFVHEKTLIVSLINGISSEDFISKSYGKEKVVKSYFIGHSAMCNIVDGKKYYFQDGVGKIVLEKNVILQKIFDELNLDYEVSDNIIYSQWVKLGVNIVLNQLSAKYELLVGELRSRENFISEANNLLDEVVLIAKAVGLMNLDKYKKDVFDSINLIADDGKTSMYQDVIAKNRTEVDIFSGEILKLGQAFGLPTD